MATKLVVGRNQEENEHLQNIDNNKYYHLKTVGIPGPHGLLSKTTSTSDKELAVKIMLSYTKANHKDNYAITFDGDEIKGRPFNTRAEANAFNIL